MTRQFGHDPMNLRLMSPILRALMIAHVGVSLGAAMSLCGCEGKAPPAPGGGPGDAVLEGGAAAGGQAVQPVTPQRLTASQWSDLVRRQYKDNDTAKAAFLAHIPEIVARGAQEDVDRKELVMPPPSGWKPEDVRRKLKLNLIPEKTTVRKGEKFRCRLEVQNVGREPVRFYEPFSAFVKRGILNGPHDYKFFVTPPGGKERQVWQPVMPADGIQQYVEYKFPDSMTVEEKDAAFERIKAKDRADDGLSLTLNSGETLIPRPNLPGSNRFRDLKELDLKELGKYRIKAVYDDRPDPPTEDYLQSLVRDGRSREKYLRDHAEWTRNSIHAGSNVVFLEVVP